MMLVLSRQQGEEIVIGDGIRVCVVEIRAGRVNLGISAPRDVAVHRREIWESIEAENIEEHRQRETVLGNVLRDLVPMRRGFVVDHI